jgi:ferric-dicitrate binding protein FerR (iron transport regulator)
MFSLEMRPNENVTYSTERVAKKQHTQPVSSRATVAAKPIPEPVVIDSNIKTELYMSWKDDLWVIEKQRLGALSKDFERRYNVHIKFSSEGVMDYHFSGTIQRETIEQVMKILRRTIPLKYSFDKNLITIGEDQALMKEFHSKIK